jgi:hypothetical protein
MNLVDIIRTWLDNEPDLKHFKVEHSNAEDFDMDWITCPCCDHILVSIKESSVVAMTRPSSSTLYLPNFFEISAHHPQFFEMIKFSMLKYHEIYELH